MDKRRGDKRKEKLEGQTFNSLFVEEYVGKSKYLCICKECNKKTYATNTQLKNGIKKSCGCIRTKLQSKAKTVHGDSRTRLYAIYKGMKKRCYGTCDKKIMKNYKNRGITVCDEWLNSWIAFKEWALSNGYKNNLTIDRIDNNKGYSPDNCRWITMQEQSNNKRTNMFITINNETHTMAEWCRINNVSVGAACKRIEKYNWDPVVAVTKPVRKVTPYGPYSRKKIADERAKYGVRWKETSIEFNGETHNTADWGRITGIGRATIAWRLKNGWTIQEALTKPVKQLASNIDNV